MESEDIYIERETKEKQQEETNAKNNLFSDMGIERIEVCIERVEVCRLATFPLPCFLC